MKNQGKQGNCREETAKGRSGSREQVECYTGAAAGLLQAGVWSPGAQREEGGAVGRRLVQEQEQQEQQEEQE